ncbi:MAG: hypothetical protein U0667_08790 [Chloroflexota bacterium]
MSGREIGVFRVEDGKIAEVWFYTAEDADAVSEFMRGRARSHHGVPRGAGRNCECAMRAALTVGTTRHGADGQPCSPP